VPGPLDFATGVVAENQNQGLMQRITRIERAVELGQPQRDPVPVQDRQDLLQLTAAERPVSAADDDRIEVTARIGDGLQQGKGSRPVTASPAIDDLRVGLAAVLPTYMIPTLFTVLETLPAGPNGKVDLARLTELVTPYSGSL
jgi:hypothetical protein